MSAKKLPDIITVESEIKHMIFDFIEGRKKNLDELEKAIRDDDWKEVSRIGHIINGVSGAYGFDGLGEAGKEIECLAEKKKKEGILILLQEMRAHLASVQIVYE